MNLARANSSASAIGVSAGMFLWIQTNRVKPKDTETNKDKQRQTETITDNQGQPEYDKYTQGQTQTR